jgi:hypothetical protein
VQSSSASSYPRGMGLLSYLCSRTSKLNINSGRLACYQRIKYISIMSNRGRFLKLSLKEHQQILLQREPEALCLISLVDLEAHSN